MSALPSRGEVFVGRDAAGRTLRISGHPDQDRVVLSTWQGQQCLATVRISLAELPDVVRALVAAAVPEAGPAPGRPATVTHLHRRIAPTSRSAFAFADAVRAGVRAFTASWTTRRNGTPG